MITISQSYAQETSAESCLDISSVYHSLKDDPTTAPSKTYAHDKAETPTMDVDMAEQCEAEHAPSLLHAESQPGDESDQDLGHRMGPDELAQCGRRCEAVAVDNFTSRYAPDRDCSWFCSWLQIGRAHV